MPGKKSKSSRQPPAVSSPRVAAPEAARPRLNRHGSLNRKILDQVEAAPGITQHELARELGEKALLVLSGVDQLVSRGEIARCDGGQLYLADQVPDEQGSGDQSSAGLEKDRGTRPEHTLFWARVVLMFYQLLKDKRGISLEISHQGLRIFFLQEKLIAVRRYVRESRCEISIYGSFADAEAAAFLSSLGLSDARVSASGNLITLRCKGAGEVLEKRSVLNQLVEFVAQQQVQRRRGASAQA